MTDEEFEKELDKMYDKWDKYQAEMEELGLINYGDSGYYWRNPEEYEKDSKICELESEVERLEHKLAEKEQEIESYKDNWNMLCNYLGENIAKNYSKDYEFIYSEVLEKVNELKRYDYERFQNKIDFAVEKVERVKNFNIQQVFSSNPLNNFIDQLITEIKEGK